MWLGQVSNAVVQSECCWLCACTPALGCPLLDKYLSIREHEPGQPGTHHVSWASLCGSRQESSQESISLLTKIKASSWKLQVNTLQNWLAEYHVYAHSFIGRRREFYLLRKLYPVSLYALQSSITHLTYFVQRLRKPFVSKVSHDTHRQSLLLGFQWFSPVQQWLNHSQYFIKSFGTLILLQGSLNLSYSYTTTAVRPIDFSGIDLNHPVTGSWMHVSAEIMSSI